MDRPRKSVLAAVGLVAGLLAAGGPVAPPDADGRRYAALVQWARRHRPPRSRWRDGDLEVGHTPSARRAVRRHWERAYRLVMGQPMSARTWRRLERAMKREYIRGRGSLAARFLARVIEQQEQRAMAAMAKELRDNPVQEAS